MLTGGLATTQQRSRAPRRPRHVGLHHAGKVSMGRLTGPLLPARCCTPGRRRCNRSLNRVEDNCHRLRTPSMTASPSVPDAVTPISCSRQVTSLQCLTISCAVCDLAAWEEYVVHSHSERDLWEWISGEGWTCLLYTSDAA